MEDKKQKAELLKNQSDIINSLSGIAIVFNTSEQKIAFIFLIFVSIILELMVFSSATFNGKLLSFKIKKNNKKLTKKEKEKKKGQFFFKRIA